MNKPPPYPDAINVSQLYPSLVPDGAVPSAPTDESLNVGRSSEAHPRSSDRSGGNAPAASGNTITAGTQLGVPPAYDGCAYYGPVFLPPGMVYIPGTNPDATGAAYMVGGVDGTCNLLAVTNNMQV